MLARCDDCNKPFVTAVAGRQSCPRCGALVDVEAPPGTPQAPAAVPPGDAPSEDGPSVSPSPPEVSAPGVAPAVAAPAVGDGPDAQAGAAVQGWEQVGFFPLLWSVVTNPAHTLQATASMPHSHARRFARRCALAGVAGTYALALLVPAAAPEAADDATLTAQCVAQQVRQWNADHAWLDGLMLLLSPLWAALLSRMLPWFLGLLADAMGAPGSGPSSKRALCLALAPLCLAALPVMPLAACMGWALVLSALALHLTRGLPSGMALATAAVPAVMLAGGKIMVWVNLVLPCAGAE